MELKVNEGIIHGAAKSKQRQAGGGQERGEREEKETRGGRGWRFPSYYE